MTTVTQRDVHVRRVSFGMRGCSCTCSPCDCDPCNCDDSRRPNFPHWRVSGLSIDAGELCGQDASGLFLLSFSQPTQQGSNEEWQEVILIDERATNERTNYTASGAI